jgi:hypothetical protein
MKSQAALALSLLLCIVVAEGRRNMSQVKKPVTFEQLNSQHLLVDKCNCNVIWVLKVVYGTSNKMKLDWYVYFDYILSGESCFA